MARLQLPGAGVGVEAGAGEKVVARRFALTSMPLCHSVVGKLCDDKMFVAWRW